MARPMNALPEHNTPEALFAKELRALHDRAGRPTMTDMARRTGVSAASLSLAHSGLRTPTWRTTKAYVTACRGNVPKWRARWETLKTQTCARRPGFAPDFSLFAQGPTVPPPNIDTERDLARYLDFVRRSRGLSLRAIAQHSPYYSHHTYGAALAGHRPLTVHVLRGVLAACHLAERSTLAQWLVTLAHVQPAERREVDDKALAQMQLSRGGPGPRPSSGAPDHRVISPDGNRRR
ncbi:hypothetical protein IHE61_21505 [Streptomyces sp. GKU 257-1]|nr:hypothetical protein [Streptomyces sp. GKU 257-1]